MDLVSYLEWLYRQDLVKIHHGQLPFLGFNITSAHHDSAPDPSDTGAVRLSVDMVRI